MLPRHIRRPSQGRRLRLLQVLGLVVVLVLVMFLLPHAQAHHLATGDLMNAVPSVNEHDISGSDLVKSNACGGAAATLMLDYYLPLSGPIHAAISIDAVAQFVHEGYNKNPDGTYSYGTNGEQLQDGLAEASRSPTLGVNVPLTNSWQKTDSTHWYSALQAELDARHPVVVFLDDGSLLDHMNHYGHFLVVSGYTADDSIIVRDPWDSTPSQPSKIIPNATFGDAFGATWAGNQSPYFYLQVLPPGEVGPTASPSITTRQTGVVTEFSLPTANSHPNAIVAGPDGNLWFTQSGGGNVDANPSGGCSCVGSIGRLTPDGSVKVFYDTNLHNTGDSSLQPEGITVGPNGNLWFVMATQGGMISYVGQSTTGGSITGSAVYSFDDPVAISTMMSIAIGSDGKLWFTAQGGLGRIEPSGDIQPFPLSDLNTSVGGIAPGPDGNLWFSESTGIGRITPNGTMTEFPIDPSAAAPAGITRGPDGSMWFAEQNAIGRITTSGTISQFPLPQPNSHPDSITTGPDGNLWFTEAYGVGRITPSGEVTVYPVSAQFNGAANGQDLSGPFEGITSGPNGNLWFIDPASNKIGEITP